MVEVKIEEWLVQGAGSMCRMMHYMPGTSRNPFTFGNCPNSAPFIQVLLSSYMYNLKKNFEQQKLLCSNV